MPSVAVPQKIQSAEAVTQEISVLGKWVRVPALLIDGRAIIVRGNQIKTAVIYNEEWLETELSDPAKYIRSLKDPGSNRVSADIFSFAQKLPNSKPRYNYAMEFESIAAIPSSSFNMWWEGLPQETRKNVRRSQKKGVVVSVKKLDDDLIHGILNVNNDSPVRQGRPNLHFGKSFEEVKKDQESFPERSDYICAHVGGELIGFLKLVYRTDVASVLQLLPKASQQDKRPANALLAKAVELCEAKGMSHLIYGNFNYGNKRDTPLREFKIRNGFGEMLMPRYYVPLTPWGSLCMKLNIHRGLLSVLPHTVIRLAVDVRARWYNRKR